jgi:predicted nucleotidyltransferase
MEITHLGVKSLAIFGSVARNEAKADSDIDILVEFSRPAGLFDFVTLKDYLENLLERPVDLVTHDALRPTMKEKIMAEALYA